MSTPLFQKYILPFFVILSIANYSLAQDASSEVLYNVYLIGNVADVDTDHPLFNYIDGYLKEQKGEQIILLSGDLIDQNGLGTEPSQKDKAKADRLLKLGNKSTKTYFLPGDRDWDNAGPEGLEKVKALRDYIQDHKSDRHDFLTKNGCPGPEVDDIGDHLRLISINSQWFAHDFDKPAEEETGCKLFNEEAFWEEVEDQLKDTDNRNVILLGHHPVYSVGRFAGGAMKRFNFLPPILGSFYAGFHQNIGSRRDLAQKEFQDYSHSMLHSLEFYQGNVFVSGHERDLQVHLLCDNYHINSGAIGETKPVGRIHGQLMDGSPGGHVGSTTYAASKKGFIQLQYVKDGTVKIMVHQLKNESFEIIREELLFASPCSSTMNGVPVNINYNPCRQSIAEQVIGKEYEIPNTGSFKAGDFERGKLGQWILGKNLRDIWGTEVFDIPYLHLDTFDGGMEPYSVGGGAQTVSVKFKSGNGRFYAFRLLEKNPIQRKDKDMISGLYGKMIEDFTSHQDPYAPMVASHLMDLLDIPHSDPKVYILPDHPLLGQYRTKYGGKAGLLELVPKGKKKGRVAFQNADKVVGTLQMYKELMDDSDNDYDEETFIKCRLLDMLIADYDRHPGNWKWLGYENEKGMYYTPFPKDRDKVFSVLNGFYEITDWEMIGKNRAEFSKSYRGLKSLNYNSRNMDRFLMNSFSKEDWIRFANEIQSILTDEVIDEAMKRYPPEIEEIAGKRTADILKIRRDKLDEAAEGFYLMLAKYVDVFGCNSKERFEVKRLDNGDVEVKVYKKKKDSSKGKTLYERYFKRSETKEIRLYGIGKDDDFQITGKANKSILVRIIGGKGEDKIVDESKVKGLGSKTKVYDYSQQDTLLSSGESKRVKLPEEIRVRTGHFFNNDYTLILPNLAYNIDDGLELGASILFQRQSFNRPVNAKQYYLSFRANSRENYQINSSVNFKHVLGETDFIMGLDLAKPDRKFQKFYGLGNETTLDLDFDTGAFYKNNTGTVRAYSGFKRIFLEKSFVALHGVYEFWDIDPQFSEDSDTSIYQTFDFKDKANLIGPNLIFNLDFRNSGNFPTRGAQFELNNFSFYNLDEEALGGRLESEVSIFLTQKIFLPITLSLRGGGIFSYGETPFYYKSFIGAQTNHRGFVRNRYGGNQAAFLNSDLRFHLGTLYTSIVPLYVGVFGLYDVGRVWVDGEDSDTWHYAYGGGIYAIPYNDNFNLTLTFARSKEEPKLISFRVGFFVR